MIISTETVPQNKIEFEPAFNFTILNSDNFQTTSGLNNKTEVGISLPITLKYLNWDIKYHAGDFNNLSLGIIAGIVNALIVNNFEEQN